jgi:hypothetical protein
MRSLDVPVWMLQLKGTNLFNSGISVVLPADVTFQLLYIAADFQFPIKMSLFLCAEKLVLD